MTLMYKRILGVVVALMLVFTMLFCAGAAAESELTIITQPKNVTVALGGYAKTSIVAEGDGLTYNWYYKDPGSSSFTKGTITTATYSAQIGEKRDGRQVYCVVMDAYGNTVKSNTVTLSVKAPITITTQPKNVTVELKAYAKTSIVAEGEGLTYQWYYQDPGSSSFTKGTCTSANYSVQMTAARDGRKIYCIVTDANGNTLKSNTVTLTAKITFSITTQPKNVSIAINSYAKTNIVAEGEGLTYQWNYKDPGSSSFSKGTCTTADYSVKMTAARDGRKIYCIVTDANGNTLKSNTVTLTSKVKITTQPKNVAVAIDSSAKTSIAATGKDLTYQWYYKDPGSSSFTKGTCVSANYSVKMTAARDGRQIYCVVTDAYGNSVKSNTVTLDGYAPLKVTTQPKSVTVALGAKATVSVAAQGEGLTYLWYYKKTSDADFAASTVKTTSYSLTMTEARNGIQVFCRISDSHGNTVDSNTVTMKKKADAPVITTQPKSVTVALGEKATVSVAAQGEGLTYLWYYKKTSDADFAASTVKTASYSLTMTEARDGIQVYCKITSADGVSVKTNTVTMNKKASTLVINTQPKSVTVAKGKTATVSVSATGKDLSYVWYYKKTSDASFVASTAKTASYSLTMTDARDGIQVYCKITSSDGGSVKTNTVTMNMAPPIKITTQPKSVTVKEGESAKVSVAATGEGLTYVWYYKKTSDASFAKSTVTKASYSLTMTDVRDGIQVYCKISDKYGQTLNSNTVTMNMDKPVTDYTYEIVDGEYVKIKSYIGGASTVTIPSRIEGYPVRSIANAAFATNTTITSVSVPSGVSVIGARAFYGCTNLTKVILPASVTTIGDYAFSGCTSLTSINIGNVANIGLNAFANSPAQAYVLQPLK